MLHRGDLQIHRDTVTHVRDASVDLASGQQIPVDGMVLCTGWGDHFSMFSNPLKAELGLPIQGKYSLPGVDEKHLMDCMGPDWQPYDIEADHTVNRKLPFLATPPDAYIHHEATDSQRKWRLYRRCVPISSALSGDRSITIMGQIHTVQTPLVAEVQCFWAVLYLLGGIELPQKGEVMREVAEWNAWTRKRYLSQGQKFPYSLYDFMPVCFALYLFGCGRFADRIGSTSIRCFKTSGSIATVKATRLRRCWSPTERRISEASLKSISIERRRGRA